MGLLTDSSSYQPHEGRASPFYSDHQDEPRGIVFRDHSRESLMETYQIMAVLWGPKIEDVLSNESCYHPAMLIGALTTLLALLVDEQASPPSSEQELLDLVQREWYRVGQDELDDHDREVLTQLVHQVWEQSERTPTGGFLLHVPWGELVEDPFKQRRTVRSLAEAWPVPEDEPGEVQEDLPWELIDGMVMVSFQAVRKGPDGTWGFDPQDQLHLLSLRPGDLVRDRSLNTTPYWRVLRQEADRVVLEPISPNPLATGVGAGGAPIGEYDLLVLSGEYERQRLSNIRAALASGRQLQIDEVTYLLLGTCPTRFGPNGAEGGWYCPADTCSCRGGRKGMTPEQVVLADAHWLRDHGFAVPRGALTDPPLIDVRTWTDWVNGPQQDFHPGLSPSLSTHLAWIREQTRIGRYRYDEQGIAEVARKGSREALERYLDRMLRDFLFNPEAFKKAHPYGPDTLMEIVGWGTRRLEEQKKTLLAQHLLDIPGEDSRNDESIQRHLYHPDRRVSVRNAVFAVHRAELGEIDDRWAHWRDILVQLLRWGQADYLANEQALKHFAHTQDVEALRIGAQLPDEDNRKLAFSALVRANPDDALDLLQREPNPGPIDSALYQIEHTFGMNATLMVALKLRLPARILSLPPYDSATAIWAEVVSSNAWCDLTKKILRLVSLAPMTRSREVPWKIVPNYKDLADRLSAFGKRSWPTIW